MGMVFLEIADALQIEGKILATDISERALSKADQAIYMEDDLNSLSSAMRTKYFRTVSWDGAPAWKACSRLREVVTFAQLNLSTPPFPMRKPFDVIFCRNIWIYFDRVVSQRLLNEIERLLSPGGWLFIGHAETLTGLSTRLRLLTPSIYVKDSEKPH